MKLVFMGTPDFAVPALQALIDSEHEIVAVYSQPPRPAGRGHKQRPSPVHKLAEKQAIPVYTPASLKSEDVQGQFRQHQADIAVVAAYGLLLPPAILEAYPYGCINLHPSALPRWRGAAPIQHTIMAGDTETAMCIMQMDVGLDTGDILLQEQVIIEDTMTAGQLHDLMAGLGATMALQTLEGLEQGAIIPTPQSENLVTYAKKINKAERMINWNQPAQKIRNLIRGLNPYPGACMIYNGEMIRILEAELCKNSVDASPGTVINQELMIACDDQQIIALKQLQRPGKKPLAREEFLRGFSIPEGTVLESP